MNWDEIRVNAAIAAMQGMLVNGSCNSPAELARLAVEQAEALIGELIWRKDWQKL